MKHLACLPGLMALAMAGAAAAQEDDLTSVPQLGGAPSDAPSPGAVTTEQLNQAVADAVNAGGVQQLEIGEGGVIVIQAEGGVDRCDPARGDVSDFCRGLLEKRAAMKAAAKPVSAPETDFATATVGNVDAFSVDPGATADQIGRGQANSFAAQAIGGDLLTAAEREEEDAALAPEQTLPPDLLPKILNQTGGVPPTITQGD